MQEFPTDVILVANTRVVRYEEIHRKNSWGGGQYRFRFGYVMFMLGSVSFSLGWVRFTEV